MGDHRLNVEISVVGADGKKQKIDWWVNWTASQPSKLFDAMVNMARKAQLPVDPFYGEQDP